MVATNLLDKRVYLKGPISLLIRDILVKFSNLLPETSKSSTYWDMCVNFTLKRLALFSRDEEWESDDTTLKGHTH